LWYLYICRMSTASKCVFNFTNVTYLLLHFLQIQSDKVRLWLSLQGQHLASVVITYIFPFWYHSIYITKFLSLSALKNPIWFCIHETYFRYTWTVIKHSIQQYINSACWEPTLSKHGHPTKYDNFSFCNMGHSKSVIIKLNYVHKGYPHCTCISGFIGINERDHSLKWVYEKGVRLVYYLCTNSCTNIWLS
jgi:hypothetical protein